MTGDHQQKTPTRKQQEQDRQYHEHFHQGLPSVPSGSLPS